MIVTKSLSTKTKVNSQGFFYSKIIYYCKDWIKQKQKKDNKDKYFTISTCICVLAAGL